MRIPRRTFLTLAAAAVAIPATAWGEEPVGRIETVPDLLDGMAALPRVRLWLPPDWRAGGTPLRTLYLLDGQHAFTGDSDGINLAADRRVARLIRTGTIPPTAIVAIDNLEDDRFLQYMPQAIFDQSTGGLRDGIEREIARVGQTALVSNPFVRALQALKPAIDRRYGTSPDRLHTAIFGASMAGVMSGALFVEAPDTFGLAACLSPNWAIYDKDMIDYPGLPEIWSGYFARLGAAEGRRLWLDHGTRMMDAGMGPHQRAIADSLTALGWRRGCNLQTRVYDAGHAFAETAVQTDEVLAWLLA